MTTQNVRQVRMWESSKCLKILNVTKLKYWQSSKCDKTQNVTRLKMWQYSNYDNTQNVKKKTNKNTLICQHIFSVSLVMPVRLKLHLFKLFDTLSYHIFMKQVVILNGFYCLLGSEYLIWLWKLLHFQCVLPIHKARSCIYFYQENNQRYYHSPRY